MVNGCWPFRQQISSYKICIMEKMHIFGYKKKHFLMHTRICALDHDSWSPYHRKWKLWHPSWLSERFRTKFQVWKQNFQYFKFLLENMVKNAQFCSQKLKMLKILVSTLKYHSESFGKGKVCYNFHLLWYSDQKSWSRTQILVNVSVFFVIFWIINAKNIFFS